MDLFQNYTDILLGYGKVLLELGDLDSIIKVTGYQIMLNNGLLAPKGLIDYDQTYTSI